MAYAVWRWNTANGGMRFAFPPYGLYGLLAPIGVPKQELGDERDGC